MEKRRPTGNERVRSSEGYLVGTHHSPPPSLGVEVTLSHDMRVQVRNAAGYLTGTEPLASKDMLQQGAQIRERIRLAQQISPEPVTVVDLPPLPSHPRE